MIKILYIAVGEGGSDQALITLIKELKNEIAPYILLGKLASQSTIEKLKSENIPYSILNYNFFWYSAKRSIWSYITRPIHALRMRNEMKYFVKQVTELAKQNNIDIIHTNSSAYPFGFFAAQALNIPHVWHLREYQSLDFGHPHAYSLRYLKRLLHKQDNFNIAITKGIYEFYKLKLENSAIIYDGVLKNDYKPLNSLKEPFFLFVGRIVKEKGIFLLLSSYRDYLQKGGSYKLILAGKYSQKTKQEIDKLTKRENMQDNIEFRGVLTNYEVFKLMNRATALIVPSAFEAFGLITAEAMFNNCLVIGRETGGTKEQLDNGRNIHNKDIALRFTNEQQLTEHLINTQNSDIYFFKDIIQRAYESVSALYSIENNAKQINKIYNYLFHNKKSEM